MKKLIALFVGIALTLPMTIGCGKTEPAKSPAKKTGEAGKTDAGKTGEAGKTDAGKTGDK
ncbi:MAG: hypothetical protein KatS3mg105_4355 [Gemmatales bacterium]|nr:MAG: hypothetical protein KatS3mg105_4355 [Gemmatales bacterium]